MLTAGDNKCREMVQTGKRASVNNKLLKTAFITDGDENSGKLSEEEKI